MAVLLLASTCAYAADDDADTTSAIARDSADLGAGETPTSRAAIRKIIERETAKTNLPADIAEAVVFVESGYNSAVVGSVGEVGLMQVRPETAAMLGFRGNSAELAEPDINIHYGVIYLSRAWRLAGGDLCRALMKYRVGHGEESMAPRSQVYCNRARNRLLAMNSPALGTQVAAVPDVAPAPTTAAPASSVAAATPKSARGCWRGRSTSMRATVKARRQQAGPIGQPRRPGSASSRRASKPNGDASPRVEHPFTMRRTA
jgi:hypothetical protein